MFCQLAVRYSIAAVAVIAGSGEKGRRERSAGRPRGNFNSQNFNSHVHSRGFSNLAVPWAVHSRGFSNLAVPCKSLGLAVSCAVAKHQVPLDFDQEPPMFTTMRRCLIDNPPFTVSSHEFNLQHFKLRVSNLRTIAYSHFGVPFGSSNLPGAGPIFPDLTFGNWPCSLDTYIYIYI